MYLFVRLSVCLPACHFLTTISAGQPPLLVPVAKGQIFHAAQADWLQCLGDWRTPFVRCYGWRRRQLLLLLLLKQVTVAQPAMNLADASRTHKWRSSERRDENVEQTRPAKSGCAVASIPTNLKYPLEMQRLLPMANTTAARFWCCGCCSCKGAAATKAVTPSFFPDYLIIPPHSHGAQLCHQFT